MAGRIGFGIGVLLAASSLVACGESAGDEAEAARARWRERGPKSYVYIASAASQNFLHFGEQTRIVVEEGVVVEAVSMSSGVPSGSTTTMDDIMDLVVQVARQDNDQFEASYSERWGYVTSLSSDQSEAIDDELSISVTCLAEGTSSEACPLRTVAADECVGEPAPVPADWAPGGRICAKGAYPTGRITNSEEVCCPGGAAPSCAELEAVALGELPNVQACTQDDDCGTGLFRDCKYAVAVAADGAALVSALSESTEQGCALDLGDQCVARGRPSCDAGRCQVH